jgi:plasmid stability protein
MTLMLSLSPETESRLRALAALHGRMPEEYTSLLLDEWLREERQDFTEAAAVIGEGLADLEAGDRGMLLEDYRAHLEEQYRREDASSQSSKVPA